MAKEYRVLPDHHKLAYVPQGVYRHRVSPPRDVKFDRLLEADCWDIVSNKFSVSQPHHQGQIIEVFPEEGHYFAELIALKLGTGQVKTKLLKYYALEPEDKPEAVPEFELKLRGPKKWCILRTKDKQVMIDGIDTWEEAGQRLKDYLEELNA